MTIPDSTEATPAGAAPEEQIEREAARLRELLLDGRPDFRRTRQAVLLVGPVPLRVRTFWETVGYAPALMSSVITAPDDADEVEAVRSLVRDWAEMGDPGGEIALPARFRVVERYDAQDFWITDESSDAADPPVVVGSESLPSLDGFCRSYLFIATKALLGVALKGATTARLRLRTAAPSESAPFPALAPTVRELPGGIWLVAFDHELPDPERPTDSVAAPSVGAMVDFLIALEPGAVAHLEAASRSLYVSGIAATAEPFRGLVDLTPESTERIARVGRLEGIPILVTGEARWPWRVAVDRSERERVAARLRRAGATVAE